VDGHRARLASPSSAHRIEGPGLVALSITQYAKPILDARVRGANRGPGPRLEPQQQPRFTDPISLPPDVSFFRPWSPVMPGPLSQVMTTRTCRARCASGPTWSLTTSCWKRPATHWPWRAKPAIFNRIGASWGQPGRPLLWGFRNLDMFVHSIGPRPQCGSYPTCESSSVSMASPAAPGTSWPQASAGCVLEMAA
jgi:hypothetical protein